MAGLLAIVSHLQRDKAGNLGIAGIDLGAVEIQVHAAHVRMQLHPLISVAPNQPAHIPIIVVYKGVPTNLHHILVGQDVKQVELGRLLIVVLAEQRTVDLHLTHAALSGPLDLWFAANRRQEIIYRGNPGVKENFIF